MNFIEKNNLLPSLKGVEHIQNDIKLLRKLSPNHKLLNQSNDLNQFNIVRISSNIILALLDLTSCELIKSNRNNTNIDTTDQQSTPNAGEAPTLSNKTTKFEEFPDIDWNSNSDPNIQMCILLYDDRIRTYKRMKEIDAILDDKQELSQEMVELDILNKQAQDELKSYNNDKCFLFIHNFTQYLKFEFEFKKNIIDLKKNNPEQYLKTCANVKQNTLRIESNIKTRKYKDETELKRFENNLRNSKMRERIIESLV